MVENEKFFGKPTEDPWGIGDATPSEDIDWSKVISPEPLDVSVDFDLESALTGKQHNKIVMSWIENCEIKKILDFGSGKIYTRDSEGVFTIITAIDAITDFYKEFL